MSDEVSNGIAGRNGVVIQKRTGDGSGFRTYEIHQRERVGESTEKIKPVELISENYRIDPYPVLEILRENYPFYRNWLSNNYWVTRYDDVTSIFGDDANFESRSNAWRYGAYDLGRDLGSELTVLAAEEALLDGRGNEIVAQVIRRMLARPDPDLARDFAAEFAMDLLCALFAVPEALRGQFSGHFWNLRRGLSWRPELQQSGKRSIEALIELFEPLLQRRRTDPADDLVSAMAGLDIGDREVEARDVVATLLERDYDTMHGALANLWFLLLTHPDECVGARADERLMKLAYLETLRHSAPVLLAERFARHEVERFGRLIPKGALLICSAAAANRDPRIFSTPDRFIVDRSDLCQREARGQYRADGLATGIAFGLGKPSVHPAVPEDRARSRYAFSRDMAVTASMMLSDAVDELSLVGGSEPSLRSLSVGEMHTCWSLPVQLK